MGVEGCALFGDPGVQARVVRPFPLLFLLLFVHAADPNAAGGCAYNDRMYMMS